MQYMEVNLGLIMLSKRSQAQRIYILLSLSYKMQYRRRGREKGQIMVAMLEKSHKDILYLPKTIYKNIIYNI